MTGYLGIDVSKGTFDCCLQLGEDVYCRVFDNHASGYVDLLDWLAGHQLNNLIACMEATGNYWQALAVALRPHCDKLAVENPAKIKHYARACMRRNKTDKLDARLIANYAAQMDPAAWQPPEIVIVKLR